MSKRIALLAQEIDQHLRAIRQSLRQPVEAEFAKGGLTGPQRSVMHVLVHSSGLSLKELSRQVGLTHSTVSGIVDRLKKQGLVERRTDSHDRRVTKTATSAGVRNDARARSGCVRSKSTCGSGRLHTFRTRTCGRGSFTSEYPHRKD
jgi:DNA-binding MarR family transcriptional regulator